MTPYDFWGDEEVKEDEFVSIPKGKRFLKVISWEDAGETKNGDPRIRLTIQDTETSRTMLFWFNILPKGNGGHGITKKWIKILSGKSADGSLKLDPESWVGRIFIGTIFYKKDSQYPDIMTSSLESLGENDVVPMKEVVDEDIPFD